MGCIRQRVEASLGESRLASTHPRRSRGSKGGKQGDVLFASYASLTIVKYNKEKSESVMIDGKKSKGAM